MRFLEYLLVFCALLLAGCGTVPPTFANPTSSPQPADTATKPAPPAVTPSPTLKPIPNAIPSEELGISAFHFYENNPVMQQSNNPKWDNYYIDPGAMIYHDGQFHMFYNGINGFPAPVGIGYATSPDGYHWTRQAAEPVLSPGALEKSYLKYGDNFFVTSVLVQEDGTWVLYFYTLRGNTFSGPGVIGRATASAPTGPWVIDPEPVLTNGPAGAWDEVQVSAPNVLKTDNGYVMYYDGLGKETSSQIGMATSPDGIHWTKYNDPSTTDPAFAESDPVLTASANGWDSTRVVDPNVIQTANGWVMVYLATTGTGKFTQGQFAFGAATSEDEIHWSKSGQNPILSNADHPTWKATYLATLLHVDDTYYLYFDFVSGETAGTNVYLATYEGDLK